MIVREPPVREPARSAVQRLGRRVFDILAEVGRAAMICVGAVAAMRFAFGKRARKDIVAQMHFCAVRSLPSSVRLSPSAQSEKLRVSCSAPAAPS